MTKVSFLILNYLVNLHFIMLLFLFYLSYIIYLFLIILRVRILEALFLKCFWIVT